MGIVIGFFEFWYDFIVGDAWEVAAGIVIVLAVGALLARSPAVPALVIGPVVLVGALLVIGFSLFLEARRRMAKQG